MTFRNKNGHIYYHGVALKTPDGMIFHPTAKTLAKYGYEPYKPPAPSSLKKDDISLLRKQAYIEYVDPITAEISRLRDMGGTPEEIAEAVSRRESAVARVKFEYPYPDEEA